MKQPDSSSDVRDGTTQPKTPRWVKIGGVITIIVIALFAILHVAGGHGAGDHGLHGVQP